MVDALTNQPAGELIDSLDFARLDSGVDGA
jgi:hypothetical protein